MLRIHLHRQIFRSAQSHACHKSLRTWWVDLVLKTKPSFWKPCPLWNIFAKGYSSIPKLLFWILCISVYLHKRILLSTWYFVKWKINTFALEHNSFILLFLKQFPRQPLYEIRHPWVLETFYHKDISFSLAIIYKAGILFCSLYRYICC